MRLLTRRRVGCHPMPETDGHSKYWRSTFVIGIIGINDLVPIEMQNEHQMSELYATAENSGLVRW